MFLSVQRTCDYCRHLWHTAPGDIWEQPVTDTEHRDRALQGSTAQGLLPAVPNPCAGRAGSMSARAAPQTPENTNNGGKGQVSAGLVSAPRSPLGNDTETRVKALQGDRGSLLGSKARAVTMRKEEN